jgi:hypothetical protein
MQKSAPRILFPRPSGSIGAVHAIVSALLLVSLVSGDAWLAGCGTSQAPATRAEILPEEGIPEEPAPPPLDLFSAQRAWADLEALTRGPRVSGSEGAARAREHLRAELSLLGLEVAEIETIRQIEGLPEVTLRHVATRLPGTSPRVFLLVAPYDSSRFSEFEFIGANDGASGAAVLLELTRVLSTRSLPYTVEVLFLDGEGRAGGDADGPAASRWHGSTGVAEQKREAGDLEHIRVLIAFHQVCDADLHIARDLSSHRMHREEFFKAARRIGRPGAFPTDLGFESPTASHTAFRERGVRAAVVLTDTRYGGTAVPGAYAESAEDTIEHCSPDSLETVGVVTLEALDTIGRRLAKIDQFTSSPLSAPLSEEFEVESAGVEPIPPDTPGEPAQAPSAEAAGDAAPR